MQVRFRLIAILDLPRLGDPAYCNPPCGRLLGNHVRCLWPDRFIVKAQLISQPENQNVLFMALENRLYEVRTNDLYLRWIPVPVAPSGSVSANAGGSAEPVSRPAPTLPRGRFKPIIRASRVILTKLRDI